MRRLLKRGAWRLCPGVMADRAVRWSVASEARAGLWRPLEVVESGPFAGLAYPESVRPWTIAAALKAEGSYEREVGEALAELLERRPPLFVDVGAAEGYYAVGVARRGIPVVAYESSSIQRRNLRALAAANDVSIEIRRHCRAVPPVPDGSVVLVDVEGAEARLLDSRAADDLRGSTVIVEIHEFLAPGVGESIGRSFAPTHSVRTIVGAREPMRSDGLYWSVLEPRP